MTTIYFCCIYNDEEKVWVVTAATNKTVNLSMALFQGPIKGIGETLESAVADWKESLVLAGEKHESSRNP